MLVAILSAFLGGLILNFMPCVFPIISFKIMGLIGHIDDKNRLRKEGIAFMVGVIVSMLALTGVLLALRAGGEAIGWGFQLQSPKIVTVLALIILASALNLSGVFEAGLRLQRVGQNQNGKSGIYGAALTGALAIVVATPCTAPFMASAVSYASVQSTPVALAIFVSLAIGFATPFTLLSFAPSLSKKLPKPGAWMETLKHFLAFPMYAATAWLVWVVAQQTDASGLASVLMCCVILALTAWVYGLAQRRALLEKKSVWQYCITIGLLAIILYLIFSPASTLQIKENTQTTTGQISHQPNKATAIKWSPVALADAQKTHRPIFIDFNASWCITCQVNDKNVISTDEVQTALLKTNTVYMVADSTNYNVDIVKAMADYGRDGLPLYVIYPANGGKPVILPQVLTKSGFITALEQAAKL
ncbi:protein-disulfide reductase DsbD family protein [Acinetobacter boissieri]|uniref:Thiol:disulfide interchange protein DsbD n=1 Tax=Acinetobacter boissieri TaxID=1219383 RepID=A0A1G6IVG3_9GAMM|nr:thioredoxin family protein [Acinetobacter boissieri]SDC10499.1 Thiol:disulfide interchange protein DsbD [Acinetobacter boissieri]